MTNKQILEDEELLPCPFCGSDAYTSKPNSKIGNEYFEGARYFPIAKCTKCLCKVMGTDHDYSCKSAIDRWNTRAIDNANAKDVERYQFIKANYAMANFDLYDAEIGEHKICGIIFEVPNGTMFSADFDATIDSAISAQQERN